MRRPLFAFCLLAAWPAAASAQPKGELPKVVLLGDSIRAGYAPLVAKRLAGKAVVVSPKGAGDSAHLLKELDAVVKEKPAVVHFNAGLHDLRLVKKTKAHQVDLKAYRANLKLVVARLRKETTAALVFANTTPIDDKLHAKRKAGYDRLEADVLRYNVAALEVMREAGVPVNDLHGLVQSAGGVALLGPDGTHFTKAGS